jgi:DUF2905 family protein
LVFGLRERKTLPFAGEFEISIPNPRVATSMTEGLGTIGRYLILFGVAIIAIGIVLVLLGRFPGLKIGRLPGDIYIERDGWRFYFPLMTSILLSIILSFILWLFKGK